ncbi:MAG: ABC transporter permease [Chryseosolibacter sp.]
MIKNYCLITLRNLLKNSTYSIINIAGLSIGITCSLLILLWVHDEMSYDRFHPKSDRLFQVWVNGTFDGKVSSWNSMPLPTYQALKSEHSAIRSTAATDWSGKHLLTVGENGIRKTGYFASEEFLTMFEFPLLKGDAATVLAEPYAIVLTESTAKALFGNEDPINKIIRLDNKDELKVTGLIKDVPKNSSFQFEFLLPWKLYQTNPWVKENENNWGNYSFQVYVELNESSDELTVEKTVHDLLTRHGEDDFPHEVFLHPLNRWRLYSDFENGKEAGGMIDYVQMFFVIALFVLMIACINFMNLSTARSERRAREVGIRKSVGSGRGEIILQFIGESFFLSVLAFGIALLLAEITLPYYNDMVEKQLRIDYTSSAFWIFSAGLILFTGILSGSYPAFYLSSFQPVKVLKGKVQAGRRASLPRRILVTLQFGFSILLIIGTLVIFEQIQLVKNRDLGYSQENLITVENTREIDKNYKVLKHELLQSGVVVNVTRSNSAITDINSNNFLGWPGKPEDQRVIFTTIAAEYDYTKTMGIRILEGRDFSEDFKSDTAAILINKAGLDLMGLEDPIGQQLDLWGGKRELIGILDNTLMGSPYAPVAPMFVILQPGWINAITLRIERTSDLPASLKKIGEIFKKYNPGYPFEFEFADDAFARKFSTINMTSRLAGLFASLAIFITGLGLFGLAAFTAEQRTKEIGIRKVLGASVPGLVRLMSTDFSKLVILAFLISAPVSWWMLETFLQRYTYRIDIPWWVFPVTGILSLAFALVIVSAQALRAARSNPVHSLRSE